MDGGREATTHRSTLTQGSLYTHPPHIHQSFRFSLSFEGLVFARTAALRPRLSTPISEYIIHNGRCQTLPASQPVLYGPGLGPQNMEARRQLAGPSSARRSTVGRQTIFRCSPPWAARRRRREEGDTICLTPQSTSARRQLYARCGRTSARL